MNISFQAHKQYATYANIHIYAEIKKKHKKNSTLLLSKLIKSYKEIAVNLLLDTF